MRSFITRITALSLRYKWLTILITAVLIGLGLYSYTQLNQELVPDIEFPQTFILSQNDGASSDQILAMYTLPIEEGAQKVDGVVNVETSSNSGFGFATIRNEFGLDQSQIVDELQKKLDTIPLPVRRIVPPDGQDAADLVGQLSPEAVLWLYNWAREEDSGFLPQLDEAVWNALSPEVIGALPEEAFAELDEDQRQRLMAQAAQPSAELEVVFDTVTVPALPESWQGDPRFATVEDLVELTGTRNLAQIFNDFIEDNELIGPLGTTADLTVHDVEIFLAVEDRCRSFRTENAQTNGDGEDPCSFIAELDAETILAMTPEVREALPENYVEQLSLIDQNAIAQAQVAEALTGQPLEVADAELPDSWRVEAPSIITFSFSDIPLGTVSVSSETLTVDELRHFIENELSPHLKELDLVADVTLDGGEFIPASLQNQAREQEGLPALTDNNGISSTDDQTTGSAETEQAEESAAETPTTTLALPEGPPLPAMWAFAAGGLGVEELDTADDILKLVGQNIQGLQITSAAQMFNTIVVADPAAASLFNEISPDVFEYLADSEPGFYRNLGADFAAMLQENNPELYGSLPEYVTSPRLGEPWTQLSDLPTMMATPLYTVYDLNSAGAAATINQILDIAPRTYAIALMDSLSAEALTALAASNPDLFSELKPDALRYLSRAALETDVIQEFLAESDDKALVADLQAILEGGQTAAESIQSNVEEVPADPNAPPLPASWESAAGFVGASELDTTDDAIYRTTYASAAELINDFAVNPRGRGIIEDLTLENWLYFGEKEAGFWDNLSASALNLINPEYVTHLPPDIQNRIATGGEKYSPAGTITRTNGNPSLVVSIYKVDGSNTVNAWDEANEVLEAYNAKDEIDINEVFEQATFITESLEGVQREGTLGAFMAVVMILLFMNLSIRSTAVTSVSIPGSIMLAFVFIRYIPGNVHEILAPIVDDVGRDTTLGGFLELLLRLFPETYTLNIMTLSGMTVAIGRVVDDSIVVLENIYRNIQHGENKHEAILNGTREVSIAILAATATTMVVFLPLGLFGGVVGAFFLPFGLAVTYALAASYIVAVTLVPALADVFITRESIPTEGRIDTSKLSSFQKIWAQFTNLFIGVVDTVTHAYVIIVKWALSGWNRLIAIAIAVAMLVAGLYLMANRPVQFLPDFGDPTITVSVSLPSEFPTNGSERSEAITIARTNAKVNRLENWLLEQKANNPDIKNIQVTVGATGQGGFVQVGNVDETVAQITIAMETSEAKDALLPEIRSEAERIFNDVDNDGQFDVNDTVGESFVNVSGTSLIGGGFGGFSIVLRGADEDNPPTLSELQQYNDTILAALGKVEGMVNAELESGFGLGGQTYIRIDGVPALRYIGELETDDTIGTTQIAIENTQQAIDDYRESRPELTIPVEVSQGFESEQQEQGIADIFRSMGIATLIVYLLLILTFWNLVIPIEILISLPMAIVGAAVALALTDRVLGLPAMIGLLMLIGIVVTNAIVLLDRVQQNKREKGMNTYDALVEAGRTRLRPILMTATATMLALIPLAASSESGAIIAAELGTAVLGGLFSSTLLTLLVVPVVHSLFDTAVKFLLGMVGLGKKPFAETAGD